LDGDAHACAGLERLGDEEAAAAGAEVNEGAFDGVPGAARLLDL